MQVADVDAEGCLREMAETKELDSAVVEQWSSWTVLPASAVITSMVVYTDGSAALRRGWPQVVAAAGWGLVVLANATDAHGDQCSGMVGVACGPVSIVEDSVGFLGATRLSAPVGELTAIAAILFGTFRADCELPTWVFSDSQYSVDIVQCRARAAANVDFVGRLRQAWIRRRHVFTIVHTSAHVGVAGNELADCMAEFGCRALVLGGLPRPLWSGRCLVFARSFRSIACFIGLTCFVRPTPLNAPPSVFCRNRMSPWPLRLLTC